MVLPLVPVGSRADIFEDECVRTIERDDGDLREATHGVDVLYGTDDLNLAGAIADGEESAVNAVVDEVPSRVGG